MSEFGNTITITTNTFKTKGFARKTVGYLLIDNFDQFFA